VSEPEGAVNPSPSGDLPFKVYRVLDELLPTRELVVRDFPSTEALLKMEFATRSKPTRESPR